MQLSRTLLAAGDSYLHRAAGVLELVCGLAEECGTLTCGGLGGCAEAELSCPSGHQGGARARQPP